MLRSLTLAAVGSHARCLAAGYAASHVGMQLSSALGHLLGQAAAPSSTATQHLVYPGMPWQQQWVGPQSPGAAARGFGVAAALQALGGEEQPTGPVFQHQAGPGCRLEENPFETKSVVYKGRGMRLFRLLVRMKVFQLTGVAALAIPITTFLSQGEVSSMQAVIASALLIGSGVASTALWYYSRRYVGELAVLRDVLGRPAAARFSVLDFWGNREDNDVSLEAMVPPLQGVVPAVRAVMLVEPLIPVDVEGDRQYFLSLRYGHVLDKEQLLELLEGRLGAQQPQQQAQHREGDEQQAQQEERGEQQPQQRPQS